MKLLDFLFKNKEEHFIEATYERDTSRLETMRRHRSEQLDDIVGNMMFFKGKLRIEKMNEQRLLERELIEIDRQIGN